MANSETQLNCYLRSLYRLGYRVVNRSKRLTQGLKQALTARWDIIATNQEGIGEFATLRIIWKFREGKHTALYGTSRSEIPYWVK